MLTKARKGLGVTAGDEILSQLEQGREQNVEAGNMDKAVTRHCGGDE